LEIRLLINPSVRNINPNICINTYALHIIIVGPTELNLKSAIAGETHEYTDMYPGYARTAREEGFDDIADWFEVSTI